MGTLCFATTLTEAGTLAGVSKGGLTTTSTDSAAPKGWVQVGFAYRGGMNLGVSGSSYTQGLNLHGWPALAPAAGVGAATGYGDRTYDDGYVRRDPGTGNPAAVGGPNSTWNWGYNNAAQYDAGKGTLALHSQGPASYTETLNRALAVEDDINGAGFEISAGYAVLRRDNFQVDLTGGAQTILAFGNNLAGGSYAEGNARIDVTDTYDVSGTAPFPAAGHHGTYNGPFDTPPVIPSPLIPNIPAGRDATTVGLGSTAHNAIQLDVDARLCDLWFGPRFAIQPTPWLALQVTPKVSLNYIEMDANRSETFYATNPAGATTTLGSWQDSADGGSWHLGAGLIAGAEVRLRDNLFLSAYGGYEWVFGDADLTVGPNNVSFDASGYTVGLALGVRF